MRAVTVGLVLLVGLLGLVGLFLLTGGNILLTVWLVAAYALLTYYFIIRPGRR